MTAVKLRLAIFVYAISAGGAAAAHDFWIEPDAYRLERGADIAWTLLAGHAADRQPSPIPNTRIITLGIVAPDGRKHDLLSSLKPSGIGGAGSAAPRGSGTQILFLETDKMATSRLPARLFEAYLKREGLTPALRARQRDGKRAADGTERYGRNAKAIIRSGSPSGPGSESVTRPLGLTLEIVPEIDPSTKGSGAPFPVRIFFEGKPLAGALVKLTDLDNDAAPLASRRTTAAGRAAFRIPPPGRWLLHVAWTEIMNPGENVDFETSFSSLSLQLDAPG